MTLTIICPESKKYQGIIKSICHYVDFEDYELLDPKHHEIRKEFTYVLYLGDLESKRREKLSSMTQKSWVMTPPKAGDTKEEKIKWIESLKKIIDHLLNRKDKNQYKKADIPVQDLKTFLNSRIGEVIEVTLPDRRKLGVYPDTQKLMGEFDIEYHASVIVNISKLFSLFDASEVVIKEV